MSTYDRVMYWYSLCMKKHLLYATRHGTLHVQFIQENFNPLILLLLNQIVSDTPPLDYTSGQDNPGSVII